MRTLRVEPMTELPSGDPRAVVLSLSAGSRLLAPSLPERLERLERTRADSRLGSAESVR